jgi:predicted hotdog family 3-hydroxylacyl-ACP dehydratase
MSDFPPIESLLPHGEAIRQLDRLVAWTPGRAECAMRVVEGSRLVADGELESVLLLEPMAQAVAACLGYEAFRAGEGVRIGMIVACRALRVFVPRIPVGAELRVRVVRVRSNDATSHFECEVLRDAEPIATATLTLVHPNVAR